MLLVATPVIFLDHDTLLVLYDSNSWPEIKIFLFTTHYNMIDDSHSNMYEMRILQSINRGDVQGTKTWTSSCLSLRFDTMPSKIQSWTESFFIFSLIIFNFEYICVDLEISKRMPRSHQLLSGSGVDNATYNSGPFSAYLLNSRITWIVT